MTDLRIESRLDPELEQIAQAALGCCLAVHKELGPGMNEGVYSRACALELSAGDLQFESEKRVPVRYRGRVLCYQRIDFVVEGRLVLEIKSVDHIHPVHVAQTVSYLRITGLRLGLVVNFNVSLLRHGLRRVIL
jgi:GxxExxY protein